MYEHIIHYCFTLSEAQLEYLRSKKYKMTHFSQILYYQPEGKLIFFEKSALLDWVRNVKVKSEDEIREEAACTSIVSAFPVLREPMYNHINIYAYGELSF